MGAEVFGTRCPRLKRVRTQFVGWLVLIVQCSKFLYRRNDSDLEFGDPQPFVDSCLYQSAFRLAYAPTFQQVVKYLPLCDIFKNTFEKEDQYMRRVGPIYHVLSLDSRVSYDRCVIFSYSIPSCIYFIVASRRRRHGKRSMMTVLTSLPFLFWSRRSCTQQTTNDLTWGVVSTRLMVFPSTKNTLFLNTVSIDGSNETVSLS